MNCEERTSTRTQDLLTQTFREVPYAPENSSPEKSRFCSSQTLRNPQSQYVDWPCCEERSLDQDAITNYVTNN